MIYGLTASTRTLWVSYGPCVIRRWHGTNNQAAALYIQFHECPATELVSGTTVPKFKSFHAPTGTTPANGFDYVAENLAMKECTVAVSTTELVWTDPGANGGLDWTVEVDTNYDTVAKVRVVGDLSTGVDFLAAWTDSSANVADKLFRVDYVNNTGAPAWLMLFAYALPANGAIPLTQWPVGTGGTLNLFFGPNNRPVYSMDNNVIAGAYPGETGGTIHYGCYLFQSSTTAQLTATASAASYIRAVTT